MKNISYKIVLLEKTIDRFLSKYPRMYFTIHNKTESFYFECSEMISLIQSPLYFDFDKKL